VKARIVADRLQLFDRFVKLAGLEQAQTHLEAGGGIRREAVGAPAIVFEFARVDLFVEPIASP
jgi:hypothetical protein